MAVGRAFSPALWRGTIVLALYHVIFVALGLAAGPWLLWRLATDRGYRALWRARTGNVEATGHDGPVVWIHGVSVGEVKAAGTLIEQIARHRRDVELVVSTTTPTGQAIARQLYPDVRCIHFPLDFGPFPGRALDRVRPSCVLLMELEIWPNFLQAAARRGIPVAIVNGRISERSFRGYRLVRPLLPQLGWIRRFLVQDDAYRDRLVALGIPPGRIAVTGNMKYDRVMLREAPPDSQRLRAWLAADRRPILVCGSTHHPEEEWLAEVAQEVAADIGGRLRLVLVPRHPERATQIAESLRQRSVRCVRWTESRDGSVRLGDGDVVVVDTIGRLESFYGACDIAFVGGSLVEHGGQNMLEPAAMRRPVVVGPHTANFRQDVELLVAADGLVVVSGTAELRQALVRILADADHREGLGRRAAALIVGNQGATARSWALLEPLIDASIGARAGIASRPDAG